MFVQIGQNGCREHLEQSEQVGRRDHLVEAKLVKELSLISVLPPHHSRISCRFLSRNHCSLGSSTPFSTASVKLRNTQHEQMSSALLPITDIGLARPKTLGGSNVMEHRRRVNCPLCVGLVAKTSMCWSDTTSSAAR